MSPASCRLAAQMRVLLASGQMVLHQFDCHVLIDGAVVAIPMCGGVGQPLHKLLHDHQVQHTGVILHAPWTQPPRLVFELPCPCYQPLPSRHLTSVELLLVILRGKTKVIQFRLTDILIHSMGRRRQAQGSCLGFTRQQRQQPWCPLFLRTAAPQHCGVKSLYKYQR